MARKILLCGKCGNNFSTRLIKVYVFKIRYCPKDGCKGEMFTYNDEKIHKCKKCGFTVKFDDQMTIGSMGLAMKGTSRNKKAAEAMARDGYEVTKVLIPEKRYCQRCLNINRMINNLVKRETMKRKRINRNIPENEAKEINREAVHKAVMDKLREQHQLEVEKRNREMEKNKQKMPKKFVGRIPNSRKKKEKSSKPKPKEFTDVLLTTPFNTVSSKEKSKKEVPPECKGCEKVEVCPHMPAQESECPREEHPIKIMKKVVAKRNKILKKLNRGKKRHVKSEGKKK